MCVIITAQKKLFSCIIAPPCNDQLHLVLLAAALAEGESSIRGIGGSLSHDHAATLQLLVDSGMCRADAKDGVYQISGGLAGNKQPTIICNANLSTLRLLIPSLLLRCQGAELYAPPALLAQLEIGYLQMLQKHGVIYNLAADHLQLRGKLRAKEYCLGSNWHPQYAAGLLLALPLLADSATISFSESAMSPAAEMAMAVAREFGAFYLVEKGKIAVEPMNCYYANDLCLEGDYGYAAHFFALAAMQAGMEIKGLPRQTLQSDCRVIALLDKMGASISREDDLLRVDSDVLQPIDVDLSYTPQLLPLLTLLCTQAEGISHLRYKLSGIPKEKSNLEKMLAGLSAMNANITKDSSQLTIVGKSILQGAELDANNDYALAMMFAIAAHIAEGTSLLANLPDIDKKWPHFWRDLQSFGGEITKAPYR